jgi:hypothetical protein
MEPIIRTLATTGIAICIIAGCSKNPAKVSTDYLDGNCVGTVRDAAGSPAPGASLVLVPEGYSPLAMVAGSGSVDSTISDEYGRYAFSVSAPGAYNLMAKSKGLYAMRRPVRISSDARVVLDDEILRAPGSLSGVVHLQTATDHRPAIILFLGTTLYTKPSDSSGAFSIAALAQGSYRLRFLTADNNYAVVETTITVTSGVHTTLPCIELQKKFVPIVDSLTVIYDPLMIRALLAWPVLDTAKIMSYAVYCNRSKNLTPIATVGKGVAACTLDIFFSPLDTFRYQVCAVDKKGIEGPPAMGKPFVKYSALAGSKLTCAASLVNTSIFGFGFSGLCFDQHKNIFVTSDYKIVKLDSLGSVIGEFPASRDTGAARSSLDNFEVFQTRIDTAGNIFAMVNSRCESVFSCSSVSIVKISNDLKFLQEISIDSVNGSQRFSIAVSATGALALYVSRYKDGFDYGTQIRTYDQQFNLVKTDSAPERLYLERSIACKDTTIGFIAAQSRNALRVVYFDASLNIIATPVTLDYMEIYTQFDNPSSPSFLGFKNLFAIGHSEAGKSPAHLIFIDGRLQPVARLPLPGEEYCPSNISFDERGNIYWISGAENNTIIKYSIEKVSRQ